MDYNKMTVGLVGVRVEPLPRGFHLVSCMVQYVAPVCFFCSSCVSYKHFQVTSSLVVDRMA